MTTQDARDQFLQARRESRDFADKYAATSEGFQAWLDDFSIGLDD